jgi:hypothetical protein
MGKRKDVIPGDEVLKIGHGTAIYTLCTDVERLFIIRKDVEINLISLSIID